MTRPSIARRLGATLRRLLTVLCGLLLFVLLASALGVWAVGRFAPRVLDSMLASRSGAHLSVVSNDSNLFVGRLEFSGLTVTNPVRWQEREFLQVRRLVVDLDPWSFLGEGDGVIREAELDLDQLVLVGKEDYLADNNAQDILRGLKGESAPVVDGPSSGPPAARRPLRIDRLRLRIGRVVIISGDGTAQVRRVMDTDYGLVFEATGVTDRNFTEKVSRPLGARALRDAAARTPSLLLDLAAGKLRRSVTERLNQEESAR